MKKLNKLFIAGLIAALAMGCSNNDNDDELLDTTPEVVVIPTPDTPVPHTLYVSNNTLSAADPDQASDNVSDAATAFPAVVEFLDVAASSYADDFDVSVTGAIQDYETVLATGRLADDSAASPGHIIYGALKLMHSRGLETRSAFYANADLNEGDTVTELEFDDRFISWNNNSDNGTLRSVYVDDNVSHSTDVTVTNDLVSIVYYQETTFGSMVFNVMKTDDGIEISGKIKRNSFADPLYAIDENSTNASYYEGKQDTDDLRMFFTARITSDGMATRFCNYHVDESYYSNNGQNSCNKLTNVTLTETEMCNTVLAYASSFSGWYSKTCVHVRWYNHPSEEAGRSDSENGVDGGLYDTNVTNSGGNNSGIAVSVSTLNLPSAPADPFRFSL